MHSTDVLDGGRVHSTDVLYGGRQEFSTSLPLREKLKAEFEQIKSDQQELRKVLVSPEPSTNLPTTQLLSDNAAAFTVQLYQDGGCMRLICTDLQD